jgi:hypothetical protein
LQQQRGEQDESQAVNRTMHVDFEVQGQCQEYHRGWSVAGNPGLDEERD